MFKISNNQIFIKSLLIYDLRRFEANFENNWIVCCSDREKRSAHFHRHEKFEYSPLQWPHSIECDLWKPQNESAWSSFRNRFTRPNSVADNLDPIGHFVRDTRMIFSGRQLSVRKQLLPCQRMRHPHCESFAKIVFSKQIWVHSGCSWPTTCW